MSGAPFAVSAAAWLTRNQDFWISGETMPHPAPFLLSGLAGVLLLTGCGHKETGVAETTPEDAAVAAALADPIMSDPDLTSQDDSHAAIVVSGPIDSSLPPIDASDDAVAAAKDDAAQLMGNRPPAVPRAVTADLSALREALTAGQMAAVSGTTRAGCAANVGYTARWATLLPTPLQVYPRGAVEEAAGTDAGGCGLRVVHFRTPVAPNDVLAFYHARLRRAGYPVGHYADGADHALRGRKGGQGYLVYIRGAAQGLAAVDVVVGG